MPGVAFDLPNGVDSPNPKTGLISRLTNIKKVRMLRVLSVCTGYFCCTIGSYGVRPFSFVYFVQYHTIGVFQESELTFNTIRMSLILEKFCGLLLKLPVQITTLAVGRARPIFAVLVAMVFSRRCSPCCGA